jgi:flagellar biosynthesis protein FlhF
MRTIAEMLEQIRVRNGELPALSESEREIAKTFAEKLTPAPKGGVLDFAALKNAWKEPQWRAQPRRTALHLFVGAPGCGKTTCLAKWLAQEVLLGGRTAQVWRLDGTIANTAEALSIQSEVLGVPVSRAWTGETGWEVGFVDVPGVDWRDASEMEQLAAQVGGMGAPVAHLVLNLAYETSVLMNQARAFSSLPIADIIFTHVDEAENLAKVAEFVLGTPYPISFLSAGQNIPGFFQSATPEGVWNGLETVRK